MTYAYKYIPASLEISGSSSTPKENYRELFQETLDRQFYNASNWWTIEEETSIGSQEYTDIDVRISHLINAETGLKLGDDWKTLFFQEIDHNIELGKLYKFDDSTWLTTNTEYIKNLTGTCTVRRCNNTLRWIDEPTGKYYEEPCSIEPLVKEPRDYATQGSPFMTPGGFLHIEAQLNDRTDLITENQRFLFGTQNHWTGWKVIGTGLNNFRNTETYDNDSAKVLTIDLIANFVNDELDDVVDGIADVNTNLYTIEINMSTLEGAPGETIQLYETITYNGKTVDRDVTWESTDTDIATVSTSGSVTFVAVGNCTITATIEDNPATDTCLVSVTESPTPNTDILFIPDKNYVLEGVTQSYSVYLYEDGTQQVNVFIVTCEPNNVPVASYTFEQTDDNHFSITNNERDDESYLTVECTSGSYTETKDIYLKGAW